MAHPGIKGVAIDAYKIIKVSNEISRYIQNKSKTKLQMNHWTNI